VPCDIARWALHGIAFALLCAAFLEVSLRAILISTHNFFSVVPLHVAWWAFEHSATPFSLGTCLQIIFFGARRIFAPELLCTMFQQPPLRRLEVNAWLDWVATGISVVVIAFPVCAEESGHMCLVNMSTTGTHISLAISLLTAALREGRFCAVGIIAQDVCGIRPEQVILRAIHHCARAFHIAAGLEVCPF
jgi:hypothetical protein